MEICTDLRIVDVAGLPGFHNPFRCEQRAVFDAAVLEALAGQRRPWQFWKPPVQELAQHLPPEVSERIMRGARDRLGPGELAACRRACVYHQPDWITIARVGCQLVEEHGAGLTDEAIDAAAQRLEPADRMWLRSFFDWPIKWHPASPMLTDGQHRACGLVLGGAQRVPVWPGPIESAAEARWLEEHR